MMQGAGGVEGMGWRGIMVLRFQGGLGSKGLG